ncbi:MAG: hypothetical protein OCC46_15525 [Pseudodesulfovibrio sp.]
MNAVIAILLAAIAPTIAISAVNTHLFTKNQIRNSLLLTTVVGAIGAASFYLFAQYVLFPTLEQLTAYSTEISELIVCLLTLTIFITLSERTFSELLPEKRIRYYVIAGMYLCFSITTWFLSILPLIAVLALFATLSTFDLIKNLDFSNLERPESIFKKNIKFKHKPNVYILFLESFHSNEILKEFYDIDNSQLNTDLGNAGFTIYDNVYSNRTTTALSFLSLVWPQLLYHSNHDINNKNTYLPNAFSIFEENGYQINMFSSMHLKNFYPKLFHNLGATFIGIGHKIEELFSPILYQNALFRAMFSRPDVFEHKEGFEGRFSALIDQIGSAKRPLVQVFHFGANHTGGEKKAEFKKIYADLYSSAEQNLMKTVSAIKKNDESPLIIAVGDHGARMLYGSKDSKLKPGNPITPKGYELLAQDFSSVFLGIHWPVEHHADDKEILSHARIFNYVFAALCEDTTHLQNMMPNISLTDTPEHGLTIIAKDGIPLQKWEPAFANRDIAYYKEKIKANPNNISSHLDLVAKYQRENQTDVGLKYLDDLCEKFPRNCNVHTITAQTYHKENEFIAAEKYALLAYSIDQTDKEALLLLIQITQKLEKVKEYFHFFQRYLDVNHQNIVTPAKCEKSIIIYLKQHSLAETLELVSSLSPYIQGLLSRQLAKCKAIDFSNEKLREMDVLSDAIQNAETADHRRIVEIFLVEAFIYCATTDNHDASVQIAYTMVNNVKISIGACIRLATILERSGRTQEALNVYVDAIRKENSNTLLLHLGLLLIRNNISIPELEQLKVSSQKTLVSIVKSLIPSVHFDIKWYAAEYADILEGLHPFQHYIHYSIGLDLKPHPGFDTTKYVAENLDVFEQGVDPAMHYYQHGKNETRLSPLADC